MEQVEEKKTEVHVRGRFRMVD